MLSGLVKLDIVIHDTKIYARHAVECIEKNI